MATFKSIEDYLYNKYNKLSLSKKETAQELGIGLSTLNKYMDLGYGIPNFKRVGGRVLFPLHSIAEFLSNTMEAA